MFALNKALQKAGIKTKVRFSQLEYATSGSISTLLTVKANTTILISSGSNLLIQAATSVDNVVVRVEVREQWHLLQVHEMPLNRYVGLEKME